MEAQQTLPTTFAEPSDDDPPPPPYPSDDGVGSEPRSVDTGDLPAYQPNAAGEPQRHSQSHHNTTPFVFAAAGDSPGPSHSTTTSVVPHRTFPPIMNAHGTWNPLINSTFFICGAEPTDRLYLVEMHIDNLVKPPLGMRTGCLLHNGHSVHDPTLAAACENLAGELRFRWDYLNTSSVIMVSDAAEPKGFKEEVMSGLVKENGEVAFRFGMEVGGTSAEKRRRQEFEWVKFAKGGDEENESAKGYKLFRCPARSEELEGEACCGGPSSSRAGKTSHHRQSEALAVLTWPRHLLRFMVLYLFSIRLTDVATIEGLSENEQWKLMVLMTALRLGYLRPQGTTNKTIVRHSAEK